MVQELKSPTLEIINIVEKIIDEYSGEFDKNQLFEKLPINISLTTFNTILNYLEKINKIITSDNGIITYIWDPELAIKYLTKKHLHYDNVKKEGEGNSESNRYF